MQDRIFQNRIPSDGMQCKQYPECGQIRRMRWGRSRAEGTVLSFFHSALFRCFMHIQFFIRHVTSLQALEPRGLSGWRVCRIAWMGLLAIVHNTQFIPENWLTSTLLCGRVVVSCPKAICLTCFAMFDWVCRQEVHTSYGDTWMKRRCGELLEWLQFVLAIECGVVINHPTLNNI